VRTWRPASGAGHVSAGSDRKKWGQSAFIHFASIAHRDGSSAADNAARAIQAVLSAGALSAS
jgi:hypothetical protein